MESPMGGSWSVENAPSLSPDVEPESVRGGSTAESFTGNHSYCYYQFLEEILPVHIR
jgi:hypothetical protein